MPEESLNLDVGGENVYPDCPFISRTVEVGGLTKSELLGKLRQNSIEINESAQRLFADDRFIASNSKYIVKTVELTVGNLGFSRGATLDEIFKAGKRLGLKLCPVELGPHLRLSYLDQPEGYSGKPALVHQAPFGSITVMSEILYEDDDFPKGFYLRRINGQLWLRGYRATHSHVWNSDGHLIFCQPDPPF